MLTLDGEAKSIGICAPGSLSCIPKNMSINLDYSLEKLSSDNT